MALSMNNHILGFLNTELFAVLDSETFKTSMITVWVTTSKWDKPENWIITVCC